MDELPKFDDLNDIWDYTFEQWSENQADKIRANYLKKKLKATKAKQFVNIRLSYSRRKAPYIWVLAIMPKTE